VIVFVVGAASLGAEISAARLLAPYFGASTIIWANTIATVLVALSAGYAIGGRLADRRADVRGLCAIVLTASRRNGSATNGTIASRTDAPSTIRHSPPMSARRSANRPPSA